MKRTSIFAALFLVAAVLPVDAATITVTTNADSGAGSLREAITTANLSAGPHTINFDADFTIILVTELPSINSGTTITVVGNGWDRTIIDGGNPPGESGGVPAFTIYGSLILDGVGIQNCRRVGSGGAVDVNLNASFLFLNSRAEANTSSYYGGAIYSFGSVTVQGSLITRNRAEQGGALFVEGTTTVEDTTILGNISTYGGGGGISNSSGNLTVRRSLLRDNQAGSWDGGGIQSWWSALTTVENSTFDGNTASDGGAISCFYYGSASLRGATLTGNQGTTGGGISCPDVEIEGSIVYGNTASVGADIYGTVESLGYNLIGDTAGATINGITTGNLIGIDPQLGSLADNGGMTKTFALAEESPAIDTGPPGCSGLTNDQRGYPRPIDGDNSGTSECDIGAYEFEPPVFADDFETGNTSAWSNSVGEH